MAFKKDYSGYSILLVMSVVPMFLNVCFPKFETSKESKSEENSSFSEQNNTNASNNAKNLQNYGTLVGGIAYFISSLILAFCGLYVGKESAFGILIGLSIGLMLTFLHMIIKKEHKSKTKKQTLLLFFEKFLHFISVGLLLSSIAVVMLYSTNLSNILFSVGTVAFSVHVLLEVYYKNNYNHIAYFVAMLLMFSSIIF